MNKLWIVTMQTYLRQVKSWSFVLLVLSPFIFVAVTFGAGYLSTLGTGSDEQVAVISTQSQLRTGLIKQDKDAFTSKALSETAAKKKVAQNKLKGYVILQISYGQVKATYHGQDSLDTKIKTTIRQYLAQTQLQLNLQQAQLSSQQALVLQQQPLYRQVIRKHQQSQKDAQMLSLFILIMMLYLIILTYASITSQEIASEKGTKIVEIIFSSTTAAKYFVGKILGIFLVILTQIIIYALGGWAAYGLAWKVHTTAAFMRDNQALMKQVMTNLLGINLLFLLLGVVIYTILAAFSGALVAKAEDASKAAQPVIILLVVVFVIAMSLQNNTEQLFSQILSYVPFFSSFLMPLRIINGHVSVLEVSLSLLILVISSILLIIYISRIYKGVMLQTDDTSFWKRFKRGLIYNKA